MRKLSLLPDFVAISLLTALSLCLAISMASCKKKSTSETVVLEGTAEVPEVYKKIYGASSITSDGINFTIKCNGLPDHKSAYYPTNNSLYENFIGTTFGGTTFKRNPNTASALNYTFKIPLNPTKASTTQSSPMGPMGVALNGVPFFNQYAGPNVPLTNEIVSFDQYWGHPAQNGDYHYHVEPLYLTTIKATKSALLGFLLDGFPVYGPEENGVTVSNAMLDAFHGHSHATADFPNGIYHYHITNTDPYINGNGFYGTAGTVSK